MNGGVGDGEGGSVVISANGVDSVGLCCCPVPVCVCFDQSDDVDVEFVDPGA